MTQLSIVIRVINTRYKTSLTSVTSSCPFGDCASKFVCGPKNVRSTNSSQVQAFQDFLRTDIGQFSNCFQLLFPGDVITQTRVETLYNCSVFLFASLQHISTHCWTWPSMSQDHAHRLPREVLPTLAIFQLRQQTFVIRTCPVLNNNNFVRLAFTMSASQKYVVKKWSWFVKTNTLFTNCFHMGAILCFFPAIFKMSSTSTDKNNPCLRWTNRHSQFGTLFPSKSQ